MKTLNIALAVSILAASSTAMAAYSVTEDTDAAVTVKSIITLTTTRDLNFGTVLKPATGTYTYKMAGGSVLSTSDGTIVDDSAAVTGRGTVTGTVPVSLAVAPFGACAPGLTLTAMNILDPTTTDPDNYGVRGSMVVAAATVDGDLTCGYQVTASY